jgi:predicted Zn-dependent protease
MLNKIAKVSLKIFLLFWLTTITPICWANSALPDLAKNIEDKLPPLQTYPLPASLENWQQDNVDNYFAEIKPHLVGYLLWLDFPIKVYLESPSENLPESSYLKFQTWQQLAEKALDIWQTYLPLTRVLEEKEADILIYRRQPPLKSKLNPETGLYDLPRAKAATTTVKFYLSETQPQQLKQRMIIEINPHQTDDYLLANITHELGHALGIWGHSPEKTDVMYHSHTREIPQLSARDISTLKLIYQQPTRLGGQYKNE